jgi:hypothetical protein
LEKFRGGDDGIDCWSECADWAVDGFGDSVERAEELDDVLWVDSGMLLCLLLLNMSKLEDETIDGRRVC